MDHVLAMVIFLISYKDLQPPAAKDLDHASLLNGFHFGHVGYVFSCPSGRLRLPGDSSSKVSGARLLSNCRLIQDSRKRMGKHQDNNLHAAARAGDLNSVVSILASNPIAVNSRDKHSRTPLHLAAWSGHAQIVIYLCQNKADVGAAAMDDMGAIHFAAQKGHLEVVRALVSAGVSVKACNRKGFTPLHFAVQGSHLEVAKYLLKKGASLCSRTKSGMTPLDLAKSEEFSSVLSKCEKISDEGGDSKTVGLSDDALQSPEKSESSHNDENIKGPMEDESSILKRKGEEEPSEELKSKKSKVVLKHLTSADDTEIEDDNP
ncbi:hypothetical protein MLD38_040140 [Melastoma candidum]|uniref:Uncharacterized protein n=1 Tax=Melastoma candidum TaxID=119954 RepID=A0ACB9L6K0_9MYRT|nr:hypothetical protein MLD38_040140 [Melastoma candidum]